MGMDVYGINPKSEQGQYFRASVWYWHPLWEYCEHLHPTLANPQKVPYAHSNDGSGLKNIDATNLGKLILKDIQNGVAQKYISDRLEQLSSLPLEDCIYCETTGIRHWDDGDKVCNGCQGLGKHKPFENNYYLELSVLEQFANFLIDSGGFQIW